MDDRPGSAPDTYSLYLENDLNRVFTDVVPELAATELRIVADAVRPGAVGPIERIGRGRSSLLRFTSTTEPAVLAALLARLSASAALFRHRGDLLEPLSLEEHLAYGTDLDHAISVINRVGQELAEDENWGKLINTVPQVLRVNNLGDSGIDIKMLGDVKPLQQWAVMGELRLRIKKAFDAEGIEIPWPHTKVYFGNAPPREIEREEPDQAESDRPQP